MVEARKILNYYSTECPHCHSNLVGDAIPEKDQEAFGASYFSRTIGIELPYDHPDYYDGVSFYRCPDCGAEDSVFDNLDKQ